MDRVLTILILLTELLMALQCLQIVFKKKLPFDKFMVGIIGVDVVVYTLINLKMLPMISAVVLYVLLFIYSYHEFKQTITKTVIGFIISFALVGCIESITASITNLLKNVFDPIFILFLSSLLALLFAYGIRKSISLLEGKVKMKSNKGMLGIALLYGITIGSLLLDYYLNNSYIKIYAVCILTFIVLIFFYLYRLEQAQVELDKKNYELELQRVYGGTYEKLLTEVRRRQHDFKNQLGAIYSMHLTAHSLEELVTMQQEYGNTLQGNCKFDAILSGCNNSVLAGYIYYKCISCEHDGIAIDYNVCIDEAECSFALHEIIEILGIFIDNACENLFLEKQINKCIKLVFCEEPDKIKITVSNPANYISFSDIEKMFVYGYSKKGENRGIGLARVFELVKKYNAEINVFNAKDREENWINFVLQITK